MKVLNVRLQQELKDQNMDENPGCISIGFLYAMQIHVEICEPMAGLQYFGHLRLTLHPENAELMHPEHDN